MEGLPVVSDEGGSLLAGQGRPRCIATADQLEELPPFPGLEMLAPPAIPAPPLVPEGADERARVKMLLTAYDIMLRRQVPTEFNPYTKHRPKAAEKKLLIEAAEALRQHEVSPLRWCEFSFDQYAVGREADKAAGKKERAARPALRVVFALKRIEETAGWARKDYERRGSQVVMTRSHRALLAKWQAMMAAIRDGVSVAAAKAAVFPGDTYRRLVAKAQEEAKHEQAEIDRQLEAGAYLW